jgi:hypothetical protein
MGFSGFLTMRKRLETVGQVCRGCLERACGAYLGDTTSVVSLSDSNTTTFLKDRLLEELDVPVRLWPAGAYSPLLDGQLVERVDEAAGRETRSRCR